MADRKRLVPLITIATLLLVGLGWATWQVVEVYGSTPNPTVDTRAAQRRLFEEATGVPAAEAGTAWRELMDVCADLEAAAERVAARYEGAERPPRDEWFDEIDFGLVMRVDATGEDVDPEREALAILWRRGARERLDAFAAGGPALRPDTREGPVALQLMIDDLGDLRALAQALGASMRLAAVEGDLESSARHFDRMLAVARTAALQPQLIGYLTGAAIEALAFGELGFELMEHEFDEPACRMLLASIDTHAGSAPSLAYALEAERLYYHDWIQWSYSDDGEGNGYLVSAPALDGSFSGSSGQSFFGAAVSRFFMASRAEIRDVYDRYVDETLAASRAPAAARAAALEAAEQRVATLSARYGLVKVLTASLARVVDSDARRLTRSKGTRIMVALALHRARHGDYPPTLEALGPEILAGPPADLPFRYRPLDDDPRGRPYALHAVPPDHEPHEINAARPSD